MENATPLPLRITTIPEEVPLSTQIQREESSPNYVGMGVGIGLIVSLAVVGGIYYKIRLDTLSAANKQNITSSIKPQAKQAEAPPAIPTSILQPKISPIKVSTSADLTAQQSTLDTIDMSTISAELDKNVVDASSFE